MTYHAWLEVELPALNHEVAREQLAEVCGLVEQGGFTVTEFTVVGEILEVAVDLNGNVDLVPREEQT